MSDDNDTLKVKVIQIDPAEAMHRAMHDKDPEAGLIMAIMYQALLTTLEDLLNEYEYEPDQLIAELNGLLAMLNQSNVTTPTLN